MAITNDKATEGTETAAAFAAGLMAQTAADRLEVIEVGDKLPDCIPLTVNRDGRLEVLDHALKLIDERRSVPRRRKGDYVFHELDSFTAFVNQYKKAGESLAFADIGRFAVTAVLNGDPEGPDNKAAGWGDHRALYTCPRAPEWTIWTDAARKVHGQESFAQLLEARLEDLAGGDGAPEPAAVLEMARNLQINSTGRFKRTIDRVTGTGSLICETDHGANSTDIPREFHLRLRVFEGGAHYRVKARLRFSLENGAARFGFELYRETEIARDAFSDIRKAVETTCEIPVFAGVSA